MAETARDTGIEGRIVNVSSTIHSWFPGDDDALGYLDRVTRRKMCVICCDPTRAYALSKLANVLHTRVLADRLREMGANVTANCVHPGIVRTRLIRDRDGLITSTPPSSSLLTFSFFLSRQQSNCWFRSIIDEDDLMSCMLAHCRHSLLPGVQAPQDDSSGQ
jgi:NAD(P)-dependent dehydrogenase (short-subunit alcohol dehydrogenase family)